ncbi:MAG: hypothetical protein AVDCRST_MAG89-3463, partial [uncultured Gemmatimonadetes bacterium]
ERAEAHAGPAGAAGWARRLLRGVHRVRRVVRVGRDGGTDRQGAGAQVAAEVDQAGGPVGQPCVGSGGPHRVPQRKHGTAAHPGPPVPAPPPQGSARRPSLGRRRV